MIGCREDLHTQICQYSGHGCCCFPMKGKPDIKAIGTSCGSDILLPGQELSRPNKKVLQKVLFLIKCCIICSLKFRLPMMKSVCLICGECWFHTSGSSLS